MIPYSTQQIDSDDVEAVAEILRGSHLTQGKTIDEFEEALATYCSASHAVVFNSATSALHGAYTVAKLGEGAEVITTPVTFAATANMALVSGAIPVFCDVKRDGNIDEQQIEALVSGKTKAIVPVDYGGKPVGLEAIRAIADRHGLLVLEDACHALGSKVNGKRIGSFSDMTIFSFHAIKPITTGEGGAVVTDDADFAHDLRLFRSHGIVKTELWDSDMISMGYNFRMTDIAAALGLSQLRKLDAFLERRNAIASYYDERFKRTRMFSTVPIEEHEYSARHLYPILLAPEYCGKKRQIFEALRAKGLGVQVHYKPLYEYSFYRSRFGQISLPGAEAFYDAELSIPCHQKMTSADAAFVAETLVETVSAHGPGA